MSVQNLESTRRKTIPKGKYSFILHKCKQCLYTTRSLFFMKNHIQRHRNIGPLKLFDCSKSTPESFLCKTCHFKTHETVKFNNHIKKHNTKPNCFLCELCSYKGRNITLLRQHMICHDSNKKPINCEYCSFTCKRRPTLNRHLIDKHTLNWFECHLCSYKSQVRFKFKEHVVNEHADSAKTKWFDCERCSSLFWTQEELYSHKISRHHYFYYVAPKNVKLYHCDTCGYKSRDEVLLWKHQATHRKKLKCELCSFVTNLEGWLYRHMFMKHSQPKEGCDYMFYCRKTKKCTYKTPSMQCFAYHITNKHPSEKRFRCNHCEYKAKHKRSLERHMYVTHTANEEIIWFKCNKCPAKFKLKRSLTVHMKIHNKVKEVNRVYCDKCEYKAKDNNRLENHIIVKHMDPKDIVWLKCDKCPETFKLKGKLQSHMTYKHPTKEIKWVYCPNCPHKTIQKSNLKVHMISKHSSFKPWTKK